MILYADAEKQPQLPDELEQVVIEEGRMVEGTKFLLSGGTSEQMFFCPDEDNWKESCVVRKNFEEAQPLECSSKLIPIIESMTGGCGGNTNAHFYRTQYKVG